MKKCEEQKTITLVKYIANDGKEFREEKQCLRYEKIEEMRLKRELCKHMLVLNGFPPCNGEENYESHNYAWFLVENQNDVQIINEAYDTSFVCQAFPDYICVETEDSDERAYYSQLGVTLSDCKEYVEELFSQLGVTVYFSSIQKK